MRNEPKTNFGHGVAETDDISIGISDDGQRYVIQHDPSGETVELGADGAEAGSLSLGELSVSGTQTHPENEAVRPLETTGYLTTGRSEYKHGLNLSGTRESAWIRPMIWEDTTFTNTTYQDIASGMYMGPIECPPGKVPVLRMWVDIVSNDAGETASVNITNGERGTAEPFYEFTTGTGTNSLQTYREVYLNEENFGTATRDMNTHALQFQTKVSGGTNGGTLFGRSAVGLDYEVI